MHVNTDGLRAGANTSYSAADHAYEGAGTLSRAGVNGSIFGDFAAATSFHRAVSGAHNRHTKLLSDNHEALGRIGDKAHRAASGFADMEDKNTDRLERLQWVNTPA